MEDTQMSCACYNLNYCVLKLYLTTKLKRTLFMVLLHLDMK